MSKLLGEEMKKNLIIGIGADHRGYEMKEFLKQYDALNDSSITWHDVGAFSDERSDYPQFAKDVSKKIQNNEIDYGILLCGTGVGMAIAANRFSDIYAALVWNEDVAQRSKEEDNANVLVLPADYINKINALEMVKVWLKAEFKNGRYAKRIAQINNLD